VAVAQSQYWTNSEGLVFVTRSDGTTFRANPLNIGVESELYTRFVDENVKDTTVEEWFAETIDAPATRMIEHLIDPANIRRTPFRADPSKADTAKAVGFRVKPYIDRVSLPVEIRRAISSYLAALLVRHPTYLAKLTQFHKGDKTTVESARNRALDNMIHLYKIYAEKIESSVLMITRRVGSAEYLYADGGLMVKEPWRREFGIPFDIHAPLTPDIAIQVLPIPFQFADDLLSAAIGESTSQGVARQNRIILGGAKRFVFSRQTPPVKFIQKNFGQPAPENIWYGIINGRLQAGYNSSRK
jgi:hypothetical protein